MAIVQRTPPAGGQQVIAAALARRMPRALTLSPLGGSPSTGAPLPLYTLDLDQTGGSHPARSARLVGWRYPVVGGPEPGLAHLSADAAAGTYEGLTRGFLPRRLIEAAEVAQEVLGSSASRYEARLLQIPALRIMALWMAGPEDRYILLTDGRDTAPQGPPPIVDDLRPVIEAAEPRRALRDRPPGLGPSSAE